jgi:hypothetical protein
MYCLIFSRNSELASASDAAMRKEPLEKEGNGLLTSISRSNPINRVVFPGLDGSLSEL